MAKAIRRQCFISNAAVFLVGSVPLLHPEVQTVEDYSAGPSRSSTGQFRTLVAAASQYRGNRSCPARRCGHRIDFINATFVREGVAS